MQFCNVFGHPPILIYYQLILTWLLKMCPVHVPDKAILSQRGKFENHKNMRKSPKSKLVCHYGRWLRGNNIETGRRVLTLTCQIIVQQILLFFGRKNTCTTLLGPTRLLISEIFPSKPNFHLNSWEKILPTQPY